MKEYSPDLGNGKGINNSLMEQWKGYGELLLEKITQSWERVKCDKETQNIPDFLNVR